MLLNLEKKSLHSSSCCFSASQAINILTLVVSHVSVEFDAEMGDKIKNKIVLNSSFGPLNMLRNGFNAPLN